MKSNRDLILILAKGHSQRIPNKNLVDVAGRPMLSYVIDIAKECRSQAIVVSTDSEQIVDLARQHGVSVVRRDKEWDSDTDFGCTANRLMERSIERYMSQSQRDDFDTCTVLLGTGIFIRPSWIRMAKKLISDETIHKNSPVSHVCVRDCTGAMCFRLGNTAFRNTLFVQHFGINIDIDYPVDLQLARSVMSLVNQERIDYSLDEHIHEDDDKIKRAMERDLNYPVGYTMA